MHTRLTSFAVSLTFLVCGQIHAAEARLLPERASSDDRWIIAGTKIYVSPNAPPLENGWVLVADGKIEAVGAAPAMRPAGVRVSSACSNGVITAGFQNSHVHLMGAAFTDVAHQPYADVEAALSGMFTRFGFTTVVDTGSDIRETMAVRRRVSRGDIKGPAILTVGNPLYPENGIPFYLRDLPPEVLEQLAQPATPEEAVAVVQGNFARGANGTKLFVVTPQGGGEFKRMSAEVARAAADEAHRLGGFVVAHPTDPDGVQAAVAAGVDIIAHTTIDPPNSAWSADLIQRMVARHVAVIPTLKLWRYELDKAQVPIDIRERIVGDAERQLRAFSDAGGQVLFGTDVGYMTDFDPTDEYALMARAGLTPMQILASLTTAPAARWRAGRRRGRIVSGLDADLVVLNGDPAEDVRDFAAVKCTIRGGREVFIRDGANGL